MNFFYFLPEATNEVLLLERSECKTLVEEVDKKKTISPQLYYLN